MRVSGRLSQIALVCPILCTSLAFAGATSDQGAAERVLGPHWKHLAQRAGMIFTGTVLATAAIPAAAYAAHNLPAAQPGRGFGGNFLELRFRIDRSIAGVEPGQIVTVRQWTGASSRQPALRPGERVLLFLYPPSRLGLTSPVGGASGQIRLDSTGQSVAERAPPGQSKSRGERDLAAAAPEVNNRVPVAQLERAIRAARGD